MGGVVLVVIAALYAMLMIARTGPRGDRGHDLLRWSWLMLPTGVLTCTGALVAFDVLTEDGARVLNPAVDRAVDLTILALCLGPPIVGYLLSCRASRLLARIYALAPALVMVLTATLATHLLAIGPSLSQWRPLPSTVAALGVLGLAITASLDAWAAHHVQV